MSAHRPEEEQQRFEVRPFAPEDRPHVRRLLHEGVLPGRVDYESREAGRIRNLLGSERERFFVAVEDEQVIGCVALMEAERDVGQLHWLRVDPAWQEGLQVARALVRAAAAHAREVGLLKLAMHAPPDAEQRVASYYRRLGFELTRARDISGVHVLEFYLNLYERPEL